MDISRTSFAAYLAFTLVSPLAAQPELTVQTVSSGVLVADLVDRVVDPTADYVVDPASPTTNIAGGGVTDARSIGFFDNGDIASGTSLNDPTDPTAVFAGGIGMDRGVCLCTGLIADDESPLPNDETGNPPVIPAVLDVGVLGPNNGGFITDDIPPALNEGEVSVDLQGPGVADSDFATANPSLPVGGDPAVLQFDIELMSPGVLSVRFAFGSDEFPAFALGTFNDSLAILIRQNGVSTPEFVNIATITIPSGDPDIPPTVMPFSLQEIADCGPLFRLNQMAPQAAASFPSSGHIIPPQPPGGPQPAFYDHEFGGATAVLTRSSKVLPAGEYTIKFVVQDVSDRLVDAALFVEEDSLKMLSFANGDYNTDGVVDVADFTIWRDNLDLEPDACFEEGDGNGDGVVSVEDYIVWLDNFGETGSVNSKADFNCDGVVDVADFTIWRDNFPLTECATRFEGDADCDGDVDIDDYLIWQSSFGTGSSSSMMSQVMTLIASPPSEANGAALLASLSSSQSSQLTNRLTTATSFVAKSAFPSNPDLDGDGLLDASERAALDSAVELLTQ